MTHKFFKIKAEENKGKMSEQIKTIEDECEDLRGKIIQLEKEIQHKTITYFLIK